MGRPDSRIRPADPGRPVTRVRQEWVVALIVAAVAVGFAVGVWLVRNVDTDLGISSTTSQKP